MKRAFKFVLQNRMAFAQIACLLLVAIGCHMALFNFDSTGIVPVIVGAGAFLLIASKPEHQRQ